MNLRTTFIILLAITGTLILNAQSNHAGGLKLNAGYYVSAESGLNYRDAPNGKVLGSFPLNTLLTLVEITDVADEIQDEGTTKTGNWLGVLHEADTVYVFGAFLSQSYSFSKMQLFYAREFQETEEGQQSAFVNLSDLYPFSYERNTIVTQEQMGKAKFTFSQRQTNIVLKRMGIAKTDTLYIFNFSKDKVYTYPIADLKVSARVNIYGAGQTSADESAFEFGLDLGKSYTGIEENLAYVGGANPFQTGKVKPLVWTKVEDNAFPVASYPLKENTSLATYTFSHGPYEYFVQSHTLTRGNYTRIDIHHFTIKDSRDNSILSEWHYQSGESTYLNEASTQEDEKKIYYGYAWTGALIKGKTPIFYGMYSRSFGCPSVRFIDPNEPTVSIFCDNRH